MVISKEIPVTNSIGLHARPAATFVKQALAFKSTLQVENLTTASKLVNAKSLLSLLSIAVQKNHIIRIHANGIDEQEATETLADLIAHRCGEPE
jgi:phosphotransferase system HPr (HPr) family protein